MADPEMIEVFQAEWGIREAMLKVANVSPAGIKLHRLDTLKMYGLGACHVCEAPTDKVCPGCQRHACPEHYINYNDCCTLCMP